MNLRYFFPFDSFPVRYHAGALPGKGEGVGLGGGGGELVPGGAWTVNGIIIY